MSTATTTAPDALLKMIRQGNRFLLTSHISPDGDAIGSALGLARALRTLGKSAVVWMRDPAPTIFQQMPGADRVHLGLEPPAGFPENFDAGIVLECPGLERCGLEEPLKDLPLINIDHHLGNQHYGAVNWIDTTAPACGEMVFRLARQLNATVDTDTANALYMTIVSDTGGFRFSNTTTLAFEACAALVNEGAEPETVSRWLYESQPEAALRLLAEVLTSLETHLDGRIASVLVTQEMFARSGANSGDAEGLVDYPRSILGVEGVALLRERDDRTVKVSLRTRGAGDVQQIAQRHGGGGHKNAAGFEFGEGVSIEDARDQVVAALTEVLDQSEDQDQDQDQNQAASEAQD